MSVGIMTKRTEHTLVFACGAAGYPVLELLYRGRTHWSMSPTGGACLLILYMLQKKMKKRPLWLRCVAGAGSICCVEFVVGCIVNRWLKWDGWDYSNLRFQLLGQVSLQFFLMWAALCAPIMPLSGAAQKRINGRSSSKKS